MPDGSICLLVGFNDTNCVVSAGFPSEILLFTLTVVLRCFKLSVEECIEFTILGLKTIVVYGLLSFYHLKNMDRA